MQSPYAGLAARTFWRTGVGVQSPVRIVDVVRRTGNLVLSSLLLLAVLVVSGLSPLGVSWAQPLPPAAGTIGVNKFDLFTQYTGTASGGNGSEAYRRVTRAMAKKALADARDVGVRYMRVSMSGRTSEAEDSEGDSLDLWTRDPEAFWRQVDEMMDDLDRHDIQLVPVLAWGSGKFPHMTDETVGEMFRNPRSRSWQMMERFVTEFVTRYRGRRTVLFYELTNELNNYADLDLVKRCKRKQRGCAEGDRFTTSDMVAYTQRMAALVRRLDPNRQVSSGFTIPRGSAEHLRAQPEWVRGRPDWRQDSREEFARNLRDINAHVDIISIHLYAGKVNARFGSQDPVDLLVEAKRAADRIGKPLFVGEFGDRDATASDDRSHAARMIRKIRELGIPYSAIWVWQLYQNKTYVTRESKHSTLSLEPGYTDFLLDRLAEANGVRRSAAARGQDRSPPRVVLTWPLPCAVVRPDMEVHAMASDDRGPVSRIDFLLNGEVLESDRELPFETRLRTASLKPGKHRLTARAYDQAGNMAEFASDVLVGRAAGAACSVDVPSR